MIKVIETDAILFDSSVIIDLDIKGMRTALERITKNHVKPAAIQKRYEKAFKQYQKGIIKTDNEFFKELLKGLKLSDQAKKAVIKKHDASRNDYVKLKDHVKEVISNLSNYYKIGLVSGMVKEWFNKDAEKLGFNHKRLMQSETFTQDYKLLKSSKKLFFIACKSMKEEPRNCAYVTNHLKEAATSLKAGLQTVIIGREKEGCIMINELRELNDLFQKTFYEPEPTPMSRKH